MTPFLTPLGDRALLARFATADEARGWVRTVRELRLPGVLDVVLAYRSAAVFADPARVDWSHLEATLGNLELRKPGLEADGTEHLIPVLYDGIDLEWTARELKLSPAEVVRLHTQPRYRVFAIGFTPGFPYAGDLLPELRGLPRREQPRIEVAAGSVAIAGRQTGIYPCRSPGGWHILGTTPLQIAEPDDGYFPIRAGDWIRFRAIDRAEYQERLGERL